MPFRAPSVTLTITPSSAGFGGSTARAAAIVSRDQGHLPTANRTVACRGDRVRTWQSPPTPERHGDQRPRRLRATADPQERKSARGPPSSEKGTAVKRSQLPQPSARLLFHCDWVEQDPAILRHSKRRRSCEATRQDTNSAACVGTNVEPPGIRRVYGLRGSGDGGRAH